MDVFIDSAMMQQPMQKIVPGVFDHSTAEALEQDEGPDKREQEQKSTFSNTYRII